MNRETSGEQIKLTKQEENWLLMTGLQIPWSECNKITDEEDRKFLLEKAEEVRALVLQQQEQQKARQQLQQSQAPAGGVWTP